MGQTTFNWLTSLSTCLIVLAASSASLKLLVRRLERRAGRHLEARARESASSFGPPARARVAARGPTTEEMLPFFPALLEVLGATLRRTGFYFHAALAVYVGSRQLELPGELDRLMYQLLMIALTAQGVVWVEVASKAGFARWEAHQRSSEAKAASARFFFLVRLVTWFVLGPFLLSNLGLNVTTLLTGLGIGGLAAALAVRSLLGDVFAGLSLYLDRPFHIGDSIVSGELRGRVERVGLRTTRLTSVGGEELVVPNGELIRAPIQNSTRLQERRMTLRFRLDSRVSPSALEGARQRAASLIEAAPRVRLDRVHQLSFGEDGLDFEAVYFVESPELIDALDAQQAILLALYEMLLAPEYGFILAPRAHKVRGPAGS